MVARRKPEGWTEINEFDCSPRKLCGQLNNLMAVQVDKAVCNLAVYERQCDYRIAVLDAKIRALQNGNNLQPNGNSNKQEVPIQQH